MKKLLILLFLAVPLAAQDPPGPGDLVRQFLGLSDTQAQQFAQLLQNRQKALEPLGQQLGQAGSKLQQLITATTPDPAAIGNQVLAIVGLQRQINGVLESARKDFVALLTDEQKQKLAAVELAVQLMPIVPAFVGLRLVGPPPPGPGSATEAEVIRLPE